jgi:hypothetical protein
MAVLLLFRICYLFSYLVDWRTIVVYSSTKSSTKNLMLPHFKSNKKLRKCVPFSVLPNTVLRKVLLMNVSQAAQSVQWLAADWVIGVRSTTEVKDFSSTVCAQLALGPTQPPVQWVPEVLSPGVKCGQGMMLTTLPLLVPRLRETRAIPPLPPSSFHGMYQVNFTLLRLMNNLLDYTTGNYKYMKFACSNHVETK